MAKFIFSIIALFVLSEVVAAATPASTAQPTTKEVAVTAKQFDTLPYYGKGRLRKPRPFTLLRQGEVGYLKSVLVLHVIDEESAVVQMVLFDVEPDGTLSVPTRFGQTITHRAIIEGVSTDGVADQSAWELNGWFKITGTRQVGGTTLFRAWPVVKAPEKRGKR